MFNDFQARLASLGFTSTPITETQYDLLLAAGYEDDEIESVASDVAAGFSIEEALA